MEDLSKLSDAELRQRMIMMAQDERSFLARLLRHLAEWDKRDGPIRASFGSLYRYCTEELRYSEDDAARRISAARIAARYPQMLSLIESGNLTIAGTAILAPHLNNENVDRLLTAASGRSTMEIRKLVAEESPQEERPDRIKPIAPGRMEFTFTGSEALYEKLYRTKELLWHLYPRGRLEDVIGYAVDFLLSKKDLDRSTVHATAAPSPAPVGRRISQSVKRMVWLRDEGKCAYMSNGRRCGERSSLEFDHIKPVALGGLSVPGNLRLLCRAHNQFRARQQFGPRASDDLAS